LDDSSDFWFWLLFLGLAVIGGARLALRWIRLARLVEDTPRSRVRSAAQGYVELAGRALFLEGTENVAPLTRRPCVWWRYRVQQRTETRSGGKRREHWRTVSQGKSDVPFLLDDGTGRCIVQPLGADVMTGESTTWYGNEPWPSGPPGKTTHFGRREYRYFEERIYADVNVYVLGGFRTTTGLPAAARDEQVRALLAEWKRDAADLARRFDTDGDGRIDLQEWEAARAAAHRDVETRALERPAVEPVHMVTRPHGGQMYLIAAFPEGQLAARFRRRAAFAFAGFLLATFALGWLLQSALGTA
jgi:hypothetical protein